MGGQERTGWSHERNDCCSTLSRLIGHARRVVGGIESYHHPRSRCSYRASGGEAWRDLLA